MSTSAEAKIRRFQKSGSRRHSFSSRLIEQSLDSIDQQGRSIMTSMEQLSAATSSLLPEGHLGKPKNATDTSSANSPTLETLLKPENSSENDNSKELMHLLHLASPPPKKKVTRRRSYE